MHQRKMHQRGWAYFQVILSDSQSDREQLLYFFVNVYIPISFIIRFNLTYSATSDDLQLAVCTCPVEYTAPAPPLPPEPQKPRNVSRIDFTARIVFPIVVSDSKANRRLNAKCSFFAVHDIQLRILANVGQRGRQIDNSDRRSDMLISRLIKASI